MRVLCLVLFSLLLAVGHSNAQDDPAPPGQAAQLWRASAALQDGEVEIQISRPDYVLPRKPVEPEPMKWHYLRKVTLGKTVKAYGVDGKPVNRATVLKTLAEPKGVAVFVRYYDSGLTNPQPFYLALLREGTIALVVAAEDVFPLPVVP